MESFLILKYSKDPFRIKYQFRDKKIILKLIKYIPKILLRIKHKFRDKHNFKTYQK